MNKVITYYNKQAKNYQSCWEKWPLSALRKAEALALFALLGNISGCDIAEFGCGSGYYTRLLIKSAVKTVFAVDISSTMLENLPTENVISICDDASKVALQKKFIFLFSAGMLEFTENPAVVLANMAANASANAQLVLLIPINNFFGKLYRLFHKTHGINIHLFGLKQFEKIAIQNNWQLKKIKKCGLFSAAIKLQKI